MIDVSTVQAMAGRFLTAPDLFAWSADSQRRCAELVRAFQQKVLDPTTLRAALTSERIGPAPPPAPPGLAIVGLTGVLTPTASIFSLLDFGTSIRSFMQQLTTAVLDRHVTAIAVIVDSPGGSIRLIPEAAAAMRMARARKPVVASVAGLAASAAYWIASNATVIESTPSGSVGGIGILAERVSVARRLEREGVDVTVISAGRHKAEGHEALPITDDERQALQARVDAAYATFVTDIQAGRHVLATTVRNGYGQGRLVEAPDALRLGMIDRVATIEDTVARMRAAPATLTGMMTTRMEQGRASTARAQLDDARAEITSHRARIYAAVHRGEMR